MVSQCELNKALSCMSLKWTKQDDKSDAECSFIYEVKSVYDCLAECKRKNISNFGYVLHRWYNYQTSKNCEELFVKYGAVAEKNETHKEIDFYIGGQAYDLKLTVFPRALKDARLDLSDTKDKDSLIRWFYDNQSNSSRKHFANRLFIVCKGASLFENQWLKGNTPIIEKKIKRYMEKYEHNPHSVMIKTDEGERVVLSDIIVIERKEL